MERAWDSYGKDIGQSLGGHRTAMEKTWISHVWTRDSHRKDIGQSWERHGKVARLSKTQRGQGAEPYELHVSSPWSSGPLGTAA